jgi:hypothetical protein
MGKDREGEIETKEHEAPFFSQMRKTGFSAELYLLGVYFCSLASKRVPAL